jgi:hypothetical protein
LQAFELKEKLQEKLKKSREEAEKRKKEIEQLQSKVNEPCYSHPENPNILRLVKVYY